MKKIIAALAVLLLAATLCFAADPAEGYWISIDEKTNQPTAGWQIQVTGNKLSGKILSVAGMPQDVKATGGKGKSYDNFMNGVDVGTLRSVGTTWIWDLRKDAEGKWSKGYIIDPGDGKGQRESRSNEGRAHRFRADHRHRVSVLQRGKL